MSRMINRLYGRVYGWFDSKDARPVSKPLPAKFNLRSRLAFLDLEARITPAVYPVTSLNDSGAGTLREAIGFAVANPGNDTVDLTALTGANTISLSTTAAAGTAIFLGAASSADGITILGPTGVGNSVTVTWGGAAVGRTLFNLAPATGTPTAGAPFVIKNLTLTGGSTTAASTGGAITMTTQNLTIDAVTLKNNTVTGATSGGAIYLTTGTLTVQNGSVIGGTSAADQNFNSNTGTTTGQSAGIGSNGAATITINNSTVAFNSSSGFAGGIGGTTANVSILNNSQIRGNTAVQGGGIALSASGAKLTITGSTLAQNVGTSTAFNTGGGAVRWAGGTTNPLTVTNSVVTGNTTAAYGGAFYLTNANSGSTLTINQSTVSGNISNGTSAAGGGAIYAYASGATVNVNVNNSTLSGNRSFGSSGGGVIYAYQGNANVTISNSTLFGNTSTNGSVFRTNSSTHSIALYNSTVVGNVSTAASGSAFRTSSTTSLILDSTVVGGNTSSADAVETNFTGTYGTITANNSAWPSGTGPTGTLVGANNVTTFAYTDFKLDTALAANNGGGTALTQTIAITDLGSVLVDKGRNSKSFTTDQRGGGIDTVNFPRSKGTTDIGAFEVGISPIPTAEFTNTPTITKDSGNNPFIFTVKYTAATGNMDRSTIGTGTNDITINKTGGGTGFPLAATFVSASSAVDAPVITATYQIVPPTDSIWDSTDNGGYTINIDLDGVKDKNGTSVPTNAFGTFTVNAAPPAGALTSAPEILTSGGTSYTFTVTYTDANAILASTIQNNTSLITVSSFAGLLPVNTAVIDTNTNGTPRVVTYTITPPGGTWGVEDNAFYSVDIADGVVTNVNPGTAFIAGGSLGKFRVNIPTTYFVENADDSGPGSLRQAISDSYFITPGADDIIEFKSTFFDGTAKTITLNSPIDVLEGVKLNTANVANNVTISGGGLVRLFTIDDTVPTTVQTVTMNNLTLTAGSAAGGGAISVNGESLILTNTRITNSKATGGGGAVLFSNNVAGQSKFVLTNSVLSGNSASGAGGAVEGGPGDLTQIITDSSVTGNTASSGGAITVAYATLTMSGSTISGNSASGSGGGLRVYGSTISISNSTISGNTSGATGGAVNFFTVGAGSVFNVRNSTITANKAATAGGGIGRTSTTNFTTGNFSIESTIVAGNTNASTPDFSFATNSQIIAGNNNLIGVAGVGNFTLSGTGNLTGTLATPLNAKLGGLANNGGTVQTHALIVGSPAIDAGSNIAPALSFDSRGVGFNRVENGIADIGSFERVQGFPFASGGPYTNIDFSNYTTQNPYTFTLTYSNESNIDSASIGGNDVKVNGPGLANIFATYVSQSPGGDAGTIVATYKVSAPNVGGWAQADNGTYTITAQGGAVTSGANSIVTTTVGSFTVAVPQTFTVNNNNDLDDGDPLNGQTSFREAINLANTSPGLDNIVFDPTYFTTSKTLAERTILSTATLSITDAVNIQGPTGAGTAPAIFDGQLATRLIDTTVAPTGATIFINDLTLTRGSVTGTGAGINIGDEAVTLNRVTVSNSTASSDGGGIELLSSTGSLTINNSVITNNSSATQGGGIEVHSSSVVLIDSTTISGNTSAANGGGIYFFSGVNFQLTNSTVSGNKTSGGAGGGGAYIFGAIGGTGLTIRNSTFANNTSTAGPGGGIVLLSISGTGQIQIQNSTFTGNTATTGGGISASSGTLNLVSTVISGNTGTNPDVSSTATTTNVNNSAIGTSAGYTLSGTSGSNIAPGTPLLLGTLGNNGGPTQTVSLNSGSPLVDAGSNPAALAFDQRGSGFNRVQGLSADIGAFERVPGIPSATAGTPTTITKDATFNPYSFTVTYADDVNINFSTLGNGDGNPDIVVTKVGGGFSQNATFVSADKAANSPVIIATYTITPTGDGIWDSTDNGSYEIRTLVNGVKASSGTAVPTNTLAGTITVNAQAPTAKLNTAAGVTTPGGTSYSFTVDYTDANAIAVATIQNQTGIVTVEGPLSFSAVITSATVDTNTNGTPRTVTYTFTPPVNGLAGWDATDNGTYTIKAVGGTVTNVTPGTVFVPASTLGTFFVGIPVTITVNTDTDLDDGDPLTTSLRDAITTTNNGNGTDIINFDPTFFATPKTILLTSALPDISDAVTINGPGAANLTISGASAYRVLNTVPAPTGAVININGVTISGGSAPAGEIGGGLLIADEVVTLNNSVVTGNTVTNDLVNYYYGAGGGIAVNGTNGKLTLNNTTVSSNSSQDSGGAIYVGGTATVVLNNSTVNNNIASGGDGGAIFVASGTPTLRVTQSTISGNSSSADGGGIYFFSGGSLLLDRSTVSGNTASGTAGGGAIYFWGTVSTPADGIGFRIINSTISGNSTAGNGGALVILSGAAGNTMDILNSTIVSNTATSGGGVQRATTGTLNIVSSIITNNTATTGPDVNITGGVATATFSAIENIGGAVLDYTSVTNLSSANSNAAALGLNLILAANGASTTLTHAISNAGTAFNAGSNPNGQTTDQRGVGFARVAGSAADIGAFEVQVSNPVVTSFVVNGGDRQRSRILSVEVTFDVDVNTNLAFYQSLGAVTFTRTALPTRVTTAQVGDIIRSGETTSGVGIVNVALGSANNKLVFTFDNTIAGSPGTTETKFVEYTSLSDGYWKFDILGSSSSVTGDVQLRRLFGDKPADLPAPAYDPVIPGTINGADLDAFGQVFSSNNIAFDFNNDGTINGSDLDAFGNRFSNSL
ncbi:hypothetical protein BH11PLA2_BH11PLA2_17010 [soil metagenome]